jgi:hypothetical protein
MEMLEDYIISVATKNLNNLKCSELDETYGMCINGFEAWKFQNACCCDGNRKNTFHPIPSTIANQ